MAITLEELFKEDQKEANSPDKRHEEQRIEVLKLILATKANLTNSERFYAGVVLSRSNDLNEIKMGSDLVNGLPNFTPEKAVSPECQSSEALKRHIDKIADDLKKKLSPSPKPENQRRCLVCGDASHSTPRPDCKMKRLRQR